MLRFIYWNVIQIQSFFSTIQIKRCITIGKPAYKKLLVASIIWAIHGLQKIYEINVSKDKEHKK